VDLLNKILELDSVYEGEGQQPGGFQTSDPKEAIREVVRRMFPGVTAQFPISENLQLNLGPSTNEISAGGQFDVGGGELSVGGGMRGDDKAFGINFRKEFNSGGLSAEVLKEKLPKYFKSSGLDKTGARKLLGVNTIKKILNLYQNKKIGRGAIAKVLAEAGNPVPATTIGRLLEDAKAAKLIKQIPQKEMQASIDSRITPVGEKRKILEVIRPVTDFDRKNKNINAPKNATHKIFYYKPENPETSVIPKKYQGIQYYNSLEAAQNALKQKQSLNINQLKYKPQDNAVKSIHRIALKDPDDITDVKELAKMIYGNDNLKNLQNISNDLIRYQQFLLGFKDIKGINVPTKDLLDNILSSFPAENEYGQFAGGAIRNAKLEIRDKLLKTKGTKLFNLRNNVLKLIDTNALNLDEVMGVSATFEKAPGYTELGQVIDKNINRKKGTDIDKPFLRLFEKVMAGDPNPTITYKGKNINVQEFNKLSTDFGIKNKIETPTILLKPGESLDASKFIDSFDDLSPEAQKNIQEIAKKGIVLPSKSKPISKIFSDLSESEAVNLRPLANIGCPNKKADGGRVNFADGQDLVACAVKGAEKLQNTDPKKLDGLAKSNIKTLTKTASGARFLKNVLGPGAIAFEGLFALPFAALDFAEGRAGSDILKNALSLGLMDSKLRQDELKEFFAGAGKGEEFISALESVKNLSKQLSGTKRQRERAIPKYNIAFDNFEKAMEPFMRVNPQLESGQMFSTELLDENLRKTEEAKQKVLETYDERLKEREIGPYAKPFDFSYGEFSNGGIAGLSGGDKSGPPPERGPDSEGLRSLMKRGINL
jgi:hypothetical protein